MKYAAGKLPSLLYMQQQGSALTSPATMLQLNHKLPHVCTAEDEVSCVGDISPRRIVCVGFCAAGSVTTLTAAWAAVQWPAADVRCISFGAPAVGNTAFTASFK